MVARQRRTLAVVIFVTEEDAVTVVKVPFFGPHGKVVSGVAQTDLQLQRMVAAITEGVAEFASGGVHGLLECSHLGGIAQSAAVEDIAC